MQSRCYRKRWTMRVFEKQPQGEPSVEVPALKSHWWHVLLLLMFNCSASLPLVHSYSSRMCTEIHCCHCIVFQKSTEDKFCKHIRCSCIFSHTFLLRHFQIENIVPANLLWVFLHAPQLWFTLGIGFMTSVDGRVAGMIDLGKPKFHHFVTTQALCLCVTIIYCQPRTTLFKFRDDPLKVQRYKHLQHLRTGTAYLGRGLQAEGGQSILTFLGIITGCQMSTLIQSYVRVRFGLPEASPLVPYRLKRHIDCAGNGFRSSQHLVMEII